MTTSAQLHVGFLAQLLEAQLFVASGVPGVYGRGQVFEDVRTRFDALVTRAGAPDAPEEIHFPPILPRHLLEQSGYLKSFPHLLGSIFSFGGTAADALELNDRASRHQDWSDLQQMTDLVLVPAACYPVYPALAARGPLPLRGLVVDAGASYVFRNEPSSDPARLQMFHQREIVRLGDEQDVIGWRETWMERGVSLLRGLGLEARLDVASDAFFGRAGRMLAASQREQKLKFEVLVPIASVEPTAVTSFNYHQEHFGTAFGLALHDGGIAQTACLGFGLERVTLALFRKHGFDTARWPDATQAALWPT